MRRVSILTDAQTPVPPGATARLLSPEFFYKRGRCRYLVLSNSTAAIF